jgi:hypothetical protein
MFTRLTDTSLAAIFSVLVLLMATGVALSIRLLELTPGAGMWVLWSCTPTVGALIMLLVITREGYSREGWKVLGLHRLGLSVWWIAFGLTLLITVAASAVVGHPARLFHRARGWHGRPSPQLPHTGRVVHVDVRAVGRDRDTRLPAPQAIVFGQDAPWR